MPTYRLRCQNPKCDHEEEQFVFITELPKLKCPKCGGKLKTAFTLNSEGGFILKGKGWFKKGGY